jgi:hypothetical protein
MDGSNSLTPASREMYATLLRAAPNRTSRSNSKGPRVTRGATRCATCSFLARGWRSDSPMTYPPFLYQGECYLTDRDESSGETTASPETPQRSIPTGAGGRFPTELWCRTSLKWQRQRSMRRHASVRLSKISPLRSSSRSLPLKLSLDPFSQGFRARCQGLSRQTVRATASPPAT